MFRTYLTVFIVITAFAFQGCSFFRYLDNSSDEEIEKFYMSKDELLADNTKLRKNNEQLQAHVKILRNENGKMKENNHNGSDEMKNQVMLLQEQTEELKEENNKIRDENQIIKKKLVDFQLNQQTFQSKRVLIQNKLEESTKDTNHLNIKVLNGNGIRYAAKKMAKKLNKMGYDIELIDNAPRFNFSQNTVFFGSEFHDEAKLLVSRLGGSSISKPLSWSSIFDIIVVIGKTQ